MRRTLAPLVGLALLGSSTVACSAGNQTSPAPGSSSSRAVQASATPSRGPLEPDAAASGVDWVREENARPGTTAWKISSIATDAQLAGFADHASVVPGEKVVLKVDAQAPTWTATAYRLGYYAGAGGREVWKSEPVRGTRQAPFKVLDQQMVSAAHWTPSLTVDTTGWPAGSYVLTLVDSIGKQKYIPLTVRSTDFQGKTLFVAATSTYQAYNHFGGYSLYKGPTPTDEKATRVSFDRPYDQDGARFAVGYERSLVYTAEKFGLPMAYASSGDLEKGPAAFAGVVGVISPGHDEYWSVPMRTTVEALRDGGTNLAFFGANAVYWRIRFEADGRQIVGWKGEGDPVKGETTTDLWRLSRPESTLVGQLYECFPAHGAMVVATPDWFGFAGTGAKAGSNYPGLVGVEIDRAYPSPIGPSNLQVAAHSPVQCAQQGSTFSDMTWYATPSGAGVFASGSMDFRSGIEAGGSVPAGMTPASVAFASAVTRNVLTAISQPKAGVAHPPKVNLASINPPARTSTGTGGAIKR